MAYIPKQKVWNSELWKPLGIKKVKISDVITSRKHIGFIEYQAPNDRYEVRGVMPSAKNRWNKDEQSGPTLVKRNKHR